MRKQLNVDDKTLEVLGDYFVLHKLADKGWTFEQFVNEWKLGTIVMEKH